MGKDSEGVDTIEMGLYLDVNTDGTLGSYGGATLGGQRQATRRTDNNTRMQTPPSHWLGHALCVVYIVQHGS